MEVVVAAAEAADVEEVEMAGTEVSWWWGWEEGWGWGWGWGWPEAINDWNSPVRKAAAAECDLTKLQSGVREQGWMTVSWRKRGLKKVEEGWLVLRATCAAVEKSIVLTILLAFWSFCKLVLKPCLFICGSGLRERDKGTPKIRITNMVMCYYWLDIIRGKDFFKQIFIDLLLRWFF